MRRAVLGSDRPVGSHGGVSRRSALAGAAAIAAATGALAKSTSRGTPRREVLGFYYGWYGNPTVSNAWSHWQGPTGVEAAAEKPNTDHPVLGLYDSHDPAVVAQHVRWAKQAGLTGLISGRWARGGREERSTTLLLDPAGAAGLKVSCYIEGQADGVDGAERDLRQIADTHARHPAWLRVEGRPVVMFYEKALRELPAAGWREAARRIAKSGLPEPVLIGDCEPESSAFAANAPSLDAVHTYMTTSRLKGLTPPEMERATAEMLASWRPNTARMRLTCATVMPGYDDWKVPGRALPRPKVDRFGTEALAAQWRAVLRDPPTWVLVTSFNAWNDGAEIEPSREWGDMALNANAVFARRFLSGRAS